MPYKNRYKVLPPMRSTDILDRLALTLETRKCASPDNSYVATLFVQGEEAILKKIGEEAIEVIMATKEGNHLQVVREIADLWFHSLVLLAHTGLSPRDVLAELERREGTSGIDEKTARKQ